MSLSPKDVTKQMLNAARQGNISEFDGLLRNSYDKRAAGYNATMIKWNKADEAGKKSFMQQFLDYWGWYDSR